MSRNGSTGPLGMIIDTSTGDITGTAIEGSANDYAIKGTNSSGSSTTNLDSIAVTAVVVPVISGTFDVPDGTAGEAITPIDVSGFWVDGDEPTGWDIVGTDIPVWLSISAAGLVTGTRIEGTWALE